MKIALVTFLTILSLSSPVWAQDEDSSGSAPVGSDAPLEAGIHIGNILPNQVPGMPEIIGLGGARAAYRLAPHSYAEAGLITGNGEGVTWKDLHISLRLDMPVENIVGLVYLGGDVTMYEGQGMSEKIFGGGHVGGGMMASLGGMTWARFDMKFNVNPGTSLYIGIGVVFRMGAAGAGSSGG